MASTLIGALRVVLSADTADFKSGLDEASKATTKFTGQLTGTATKIDGFAKSLGRMFTVAAIAAGAKQVLDYAGNLEDLADQTGLTTDSLQEMSHAAKQTGTSLDAFTNSAFKLGVNLSDGTKKVQGAVDALGLSYMALREMSPDEQFKATATALGQIENVQERNRLGVILMGKGYKEVAGAISDGYDKLANDAAKSSAANIKALSDAGDAFDELKSRLMAIAATLLGPVAQGLNLLLGQLGKAKDIVRDALDDWGTIFGKVAEAPKVFGNTMGNLPKPLGDASMSMEEAEAAAKKLDEQLKKSVETNKEAAEAAEAFAKSLRAIGGADAIAGAQNVLRQLEALGGPLKVLPSQLEGMAEQLRQGAEAAMLMGKTGLAQQYLLLAKTLDPMVMFQQRFNVTIGDYVTLAPQAASLTEDMVEQLHRLGGTVIEIGPILENKMVLPWVKFKEAVIKDSRQVESSFQNIGEAVKDLGSTIVQAFTSGGNPFKAIGSLLGGALGKDLGTSIAKSIGGTLGSILGSAAGPLGALAGSLLGKAASWIGGLFGRGDKRREEESKRKAAEAEAALEAMRQKAADLNDELADSQSELDGLFDKASEMGYVFDRSGNLVEVSFDKMQESAEKFGVDIGSLGAQFTGQKLAASAKEIVDAFELLAKGGADVGGILFGMKDEINALVIDAKKAGTALPAQMQPWIIELIRAGHLVDENGNKLTDLTGIKFGPPIESEFDKISRAIQETIGAINSLISRIGELIDKIAGIPDKDVTVRVNTEYTGGQPPDDRGGDTGQPPQFATGTMGSLGKWFGNFGSGMGATLHGMEAVVTPNQSVPFAMDVLSGLASQMSPAQSGTSSGGAPTIINNNFTFDVSTLDTDELSRLIRRRVIPEINAQLSNVGELRGGMRDGLGI